MKFGVIVFPGSNCDRDVAMVVRDLLHQPTRMVWHEDSDLSDLDVVIVPGGFSYGDYLRCGAIARFSPAIQATVRHAEQGKLVLGICNGFQVLTECGLLPGALMRNREPAPGPDRGVIGRWGGGFHADSRLVALRGATNDGTRSAANPDQGHVLQPDGS